MKKLYIAIQLLGISVMAVAQTPLAQVSIDGGNLICNPGGCTSLYAGFTQTNATTAYNVNSIPFSPTFPFIGGITINASADDVWSPQVDIPFQFSFYGNCYNSLLVGSNGVITFDLINNTQATGCAWNFTQTIPNAAFPIRNAIFGVYQDTNITSPPVTNPAIQNVNYYVLDTGVNAAPNRVFVINFNELPQYQCGSGVGLQTSQIVLHETTNIIEVLVKNRTSCTTWNSGSGLIGLLNQAGTSAITPSGRNTGTWSATNEAWRFTPNGADLIPTFSWYHNGTVIAGETANQLVVCPVSANDYYSVAMDVPNCSSTVSIQSQPVANLLAPDFGLQNPVDFNVCTEAPFTYTVDLTSNTSIVLNGQNPNDFPVRYYDNLFDAENTTNNVIDNPSSFSFGDNRTIYINIESNEYGCIYVKPFQLNVIPVVTPPTGAAAQNFTAGETLADLNVTGTNIIWYDAPTQGNILASNTGLQDGATYYATQTVSGCESNRSVNATRLAVTVTLVALGNETFTTGAFSVYPNPVDDMLTITGRDNLKSIVIYNAIGQQILELNPDQKDLQINTTTFNSGVYFLKLNTEKESRTIKIIKN